MTNDEIMIKLNNIKNIRLVYINKKRQIRQKIQVIQERHKIKTMGIKSTMNTKETKGTSNTRKTLEFR